jgi:hypothetical protein
MREDVEMRVLVFAFAILPRAKPDSRQDDLGKERDRKRLI